MNQDNLPRISQDMATRQLALARRQLDAVQKVSAALYSTTDLDSVQRLALTTAMEAVDADAGSLLLYDPPTHALVFRHATGPVAASLLGTSLDLSLGTGIAGQVFLSGEGRISHDVDADVDHIGTVDALTGYRTQSLMTVPLKRQNGPALGVVQLVNKKSGLFDGGDMAVIEVMGNLIVLAVQNALQAQEARLAAVARTVGEVGHDIGNMLTQVLPYVQTLHGYIEDVGAGKPDAQARLEEFYAEVVESVADGVAQVQERAREIARAVKGEVAPLEFEDGRPLHAARRVVQSLFSLAAQRGVVLDAQGSEDLKAIYDRSRIYNALYNLVSNAVVATPSGGTVTVSAALDPDPQWYSLSVTDTGAGMPEDVRARLFTDAVRSTKPGGTGLGTRIVGRVVEQHGGRTEVVSAEGQGTTITLRLPRDPRLLSPHPFPFSDA